MENRFKIGIIGSGKMGTDIFNYLISFDLDIFWRISRSASVENLLAKFKKKLDRELKNELITKEDYDKKINSIVITDNIENLANCNLIIESISENVDAKVELFKKLDEIVNKECIFSSNSSSIKPEILSKNILRKDKIAGIHFFYPLKLRNICELIVTEFTSKKTLDFTGEFLNYINRFYFVQKGKSVFFINKLFFELQAETYNIFENSDLNIEDLDCIIKNLGFHAGIFETLDSVGLDTVYFSMLEYLNDYENKEKFEPLINILKRMLDFGRLGRKNKKGFYNYEEDSFDINILKNGKNIFLKENAEEKLKNVFINSCNDVINSGYCSQKDLEYTIMQYVGVNISSFGLVRK